MLTEKEPITSQYASIQACALLDARSSGALDDRQEAFNSDLVLIGGSFLAKRQKRRQCRSAKPHNEFVFQ
jgi:hypothetical protein